MRYAHFSKAERLEISVLLKKGYSAREVGSALGKHHSSVRREIIRNSVDGAYDPQTAHQKARVRRTHSKYQGMKVRERPWLESFVSNGLQNGWTPEQIAGRLRAAHRDTTIISAKGIYKWLYSAYGQYWCRYLPSRQYRRRTRRKKARKVLIPHRRFIEARPAGSGLRQRRGHFEGDTLGVPKETRETLAAVVDRASRYLHAVKVKRLADAISGYHHLLAGQRVYSLTLDNGVEHVRYEELGVSTFFCHPYRSWEKPVIENTFQRLRRFIPKRAHLKDYSDHQIADIVERMNRTPRKCLSYRTPEEASRGIKLSHNHTVGCCI